MLHGPVGTGGVGAIFHAFPEIVLYRDIYGFSTHVLGISVATGSTQIPLFMLTLVADASTYHEGLLYGDAK